MTKSMLIDATQKEETRVAIVEDGELVDFDYESKVRKQLKGSIFLAKVTRVEPSLQAAFVDFGGNRHGFLPFSEIHPDYFKIPVADKKALLEAQQEELKEHDEEIGEESDDDIAEGVEEEASAKSDDAGAGDDEDVAAKGEIEVIEDEGKDEVDIVGGDVPLPAEDVDEEGESDEKETADATDAADDGGEKSELKKEGSEKGKSKKRRVPYKNRRHEVVVEDAETGKPFRYNLRRKYKIQEVIKRGQIMLIQVSKEERGNKGAAVTSYLSLPGRYCVLMPNSPRGGGVSRKISNYKDRKRMREILSDLNVPEGMSVILRTAGVGRTKAEIKRDLSYLIRLWNTVREDTLESIAPALIYEEGNLIKRSIRDMYGSDIDEILVEGEKGYKTARNFMKMLTPSHVKKIKEYKGEKITLFHKFGVEEEISKISEPQVFLKSGGSLVINPTEALVAIDVNSGKATKERHIEETALSTNLEAADEVARQMRLRDLGGLVVIDFIDMEDRRNNRKVEQRLRRALSADRAKIQVGRISLFGLMELSRQRISPSLTEAQYHVCPECSGIGYVKTIDYAAVTALRALEGKVMGNTGKKEVTIDLSPEVALYILNNKRPDLADIENRHEVSIKINIDESLSRAGFVIDKEEGGGQRGKKATGGTRNGRYAQGHSRKAKGGSANRKNRGRNNRRKGKSVNGGASAHASNENEKYAGGDKNISAQEEVKNTGNEQQAKAASVEEAEKVDKKQGRDEGTPVVIEEDAGKSKEVAAQEVSKALNVNEKKEQDEKQQDREATSAKEYEIVNAPPAKKKKGWWNRLIE